MRNVNAARVSPAAGGVTIRNDARTVAAGAQDTLDVEREGDAVVLTGAIPLGAEPEDVAPAVPDPAAYMHAVLADALRRAGVRLDAAAGVAGMPSARAIWSHASEPLGELLADFWYPSDNLMGEMFLKELGVRAKGEPGTVENGRLLEEQFLRSAGIDPATVAISDGSGLSQYDRITPRDLLLILQSDWNGPHRDTVLNALPVAGVRGTLRSSYKATAAEKNVFAKTGSISHVRTISGFIRTKTHGPVTFSFMINQWMGEDQQNGAADLAKLRGAVLAAIASQ